MTTIAMVEEAAKRIRGHVLRRPLLDRLVGRRIFVKAENLQRSGSFKLRGTGIRAYSSGNHAQTVALAGAELGMPITVVMSAVAPRTKIEATRA